MDYLQINPNLTLFPNVDYLSNYKDNHIYIDRALLRQNLSWFFDFENENDFLLAITDLFYINDYKYRTLAGSEEFSYSPIENYDLYEDETINTQNSGTNTFDMGNQSITQSVQSSEKTNTRVNEVSPMNTVDFVNHDKSVDTVNPYTDTSNQTNSSRQDITTVDMKNDVGRELRRHGNIGVRSSQELIEQERRIADFSIYQVIWKDVVDNLLIFMERKRGCWGGLFYWNDYI